MRIICKLGKRVVAASIIGLAMAGGVGGYALAASGTSNTQVIQACVSALPNRVPTHLWASGGHSCPSGQALLTWTLTPGTPGPQGPQGNPGVTPTITDSAPVADCPAGGETVTLLSQVSYICDGANGQPGTGAVVTTLAEGNSNCPYGGVQVTDGSGDVSYACNGAPGATGATGPQGPAGQSGTPFDPATGLPSNLQIVYDGKAVDLTCTTQDATATQPVTSTCTVDS
jgi:hypothetical protein